MNIYKIWKPTYQPFIMGGYVHGAIYFNVVPNSTYNLAEGIDVGVVNYYGKTAVFELTSGGVVGDSLEEVKNDFATAKSHILAGQIEKATEEGKRATKVTMQEFFK